MTVIVPNYFIENEPKNVISSNDSIGSIARTCGYSTVSWFGVQFKKAYGLSPKAYRKQNQ
jgi:YesN/AraC family two-component response regulator